jgi:hypothetical protein
MIKMIREMIISQKINRNSDIENGSNHDAPEPKVNNRLYPKDSKKGSVVKGIYIIYG